MKCIIILLFFTTLSCSINRADIKGTYLKCNNQNLKDTLVLNADGSYDRRLYSAEGKLVFKNKSNWILKDKRLVLKNFLKDDDDAAYSEIKETFSEKSFSQYKKLLMDISLPLEIRNDTIFIDLDIDLNIYYKKIN